MEDTCALVDLSVLELSGVPITLGATYQCGGRGGGEDEAQLGRKEEMWELFRSQASRRLTIYLNDETENQGELRD